MESEAFLMATDSPVSTTSGQAQGVHRQLSRILMPRGVSLVSAPLSRLADLRLVDDAEGTAAKNSLGIVRERPRHRLTIHWL